jgi:hypothetical protein
MHIPIFILCTKVKCKLYPPVNQYHARKTSRVAFVLVEQSEAGRVPYLVRTGWCLYWLSVPQL